MADDGVSVIREPIREVEILYGETLYEYDGESISVDVVNEAIDEIRGDMLRIDMEFTLAPNAEAYESGLYVRYNPVENSLGTERTAIVFSNTGVFVDRTKSSLYDYVNKQPSHMWGNTGKNYSVTILLDRSMLEIYVNDVMSFTTRIYPKYGNSDYLKLFDNNGGMQIQSMTIRKMKGAYKDVVTEAYYGNTGNLE